MSVRTLASANRGSYLYWRDATVVSYVQPAQKTGVVSAGSAQARDGSALECTDYSRERVLWIGPRCRSVPA